MAETFDALKVGGFDFNFGLNVESFHRSHFTEFESRSFRWNQETHFSFLLIRLFRMGDLKLKVNF